MTPFDEAVDLACLLSAEREARRRLESLAALMPVVTSTLDIREIFERVLAIAKEALPHDALGIQLYQPERNVIVAYVVSDRLSGGSWEYPIVKELDEPELGFLVEDSWLEKDGRIGVMKGRFFPGIEGTAATVPPGEVIVKLEGGAEPPAARARQDHETEMFSHSFPRSIRSTSITTSSRPST
ncbi:MAG TPA: hypothetical protein VGS22_07805 [Thermoanaerobaculia bacterium]|jgi:hypothetical protein|nr:hypothetical protein [Thermoanaerobaculia bacterium]